MNLDQYRPMNDGQGSTIGEFGDTTPSIDNAATLKGGLASMSKFGRNNTPDNSAMEDYTNKLTALREQNLKSMESIPGYNAPMGGAFAANNLVNINRGELDINDVFQNGRMYNPYTKLYGSKATRNNNPGNISGISGNPLYGSARITHSKYGDKGDQAMQVYDTPERGWNAMYQLMSGNRYNKSNIANDFSQYQSDQKAWGRMLEDLTKNGINPQKSTFNSLSPEQKVYFMSSRARHEGYKGMPLTRGMIGY